jgi:hypothetical protein
MAWVSPVPLHETVAVVSPLVACGAAVRVKLELNGMQERGVHGRLAKMVAMHTSCAQECPFYGLLAKAKRVVMLPWFELSVGSASKNRGLQVVA